MIIRRHTPSAMDLLREMLSPRTPVWETRKDAWFFLLSLLFGFGFCVLFGGVLFLLNS